MVENIHAKNTIRQKCSFYRTLNKIGRFYFYIY